MDRSVFYYFNNSELPHELVTHSSIKLLSNDYTVFHFIARCIAALELFISFLLKAPPPLHGDIPKRSFGLHSAKSR